MSNENKTALTAEEINLKANEVCSNKDELYGYRIGYLEGRKDASLQTKEKDKEIERLDKGWSDKNDECFKQVESLQSTIESQQKEIEELKRENEINLKIIIQDNQKLDLVTKERDEYKQAFFYTQRKF